MANIIDEALYRWQKDGWSAAKIENGQYTLVHLHARAILVGARTQFQTVGAIQGEMRRALADGPPPVRQTVAPEAETPMPRRTKKKPAKRAAPGEEAFTFDYLLERPKPAKHPDSPYRRRPAPSVEPLPSRPLPFENAAWEMVMMRLTLEGREPSLISIMEHRYRTDDQYRGDCVRRYRATPQAEIEAMRAKLK